MSIMCSSSGTMCKYIDISRYLVYIYLHQISSWTSCRRETGQRWADGGDTLPGLTLGAGPPHTAPAGNTRCQDQDGGIILNSFAAFWDDLCAQIYFIDFT